MSTRVHVKIDAGIAEIRLDGPDKHNVLGITGWRTLAEEFETLTKNADVRCVTIRGVGGRAFSAGSDISAFEAQRTAPDDVKGYSDAIGTALHAVWNCPHPTIAIVQGLCVGGGLEIISCCDVRVCEASSRFGAPINRLGLTMSHTELDPLVRLIGAGAALDLLLTGELVPAAGARRIGLVNRVVPDGEVRTRGRELAEQIAAGAPLVNRWHKKFIRRLEDPTPLSDAERAEAHDAFQTDDYREGREAFVEKRKPTFTGE